MAKNKKVIKYRKPVRLNIGLFVFAFIFIYLIIMIIRSVGKEKLTLYEVNESSINNNISVTALALRDETVVTTNEAGYINYYVREGDKVSVNSTVYTLDETGEVTQALAENNSINAAFSRDEYNQIRDVIAVYKANTSNINFSDIYEFESDIQSKILNLSNETISSQIDSLLAESGSSNTFKAYNSTSVGIISLINDGYEGLTVNDLNEDSFDESNYKKSSIKSGELVSQNVPVYKIIPNEDWHLVIPITEAQRELLMDKEKVTLTIKKDNVDVKADVSIIDNNGILLADLSLNKHMIRYISDRFLNIEIQLDEYEGLKIPKSAIFEKDFYKIPIEYLSNGSNSTEQIYFNVKSIDENGNVTTKQISPSIYFKDNDYCYVNPLDIDSNTVLIALDSQNTISISQCELGKLEGVYCTNKGYATFKVISKLAENDKYVIVAEGVDYSIALYDHIVLDYSTIDENSIIY